MLFFVGIAPQNRNLSLAFQLILYLRETWKMKLEAGLNCEFDVLLSQSMPQDIIDTHELQTITLDYRRECQQDDIVDSLTSPESDYDTEQVPKLKGTNGSTAATDQRQFLHLLRLASDGSEINRGRTEWRKKRSI